MKLVREHINEVLKFQTWTKDNPYKGNIDLYSKNLNSLPNNIPKYISEDFSCDNNNLTTLEFAPEYVGGYFYCNNNNLTSLEGAPKYVGGDFYCIFNPELSKVEVEKYWKTGAVKGKINSDYGNYEPYKK